MESTRNDLDLFDPLIMIITADESIDEFLRHTDRSKVVLKLFLERTFLLYFSSFAIMTPMMVIDERSPRLSFSLRHR